MNQGKADNTPFPSTVYGPVKSWRVGNSLGIDLLFTSSFCSFRCVYCQLGKIEHPTLERKVYVPTERVMADLQESDWGIADVITLSGSGEPTLAANLGEVIDGIHDLTRKPVMVLTNATMLGDASVRLDLAKADQVFCKLDAANEPTLQRMNRPVAGVTLESIVQGILAFKAEYRGFLAIQMMLMPMNQTEILELAELLSRLQPDEVQLNTPMRPVPKAWFLEARGNYDVAPYPAVPLQHLDPAAALLIERELAERTGLKFRSVFKPEAQKVEFIR